MAKNADGKWAEFAQKNDTVESAEHDEIVTEEQLDESVESVTTDEYGDSVDTPDSVIADDELAAITELQNTIKSLQLEMVGAREQRTRALAELDNVRRRAEKDVADAHKYGAKKLLTEMLPVLDSLGRCLEGMDSSDEKLKPLCEGVGLTFDLFESTLAKFGFVAITPERGDAFDPERHEAMSMLPDADLDKNCIVNVMQKGYELNGRVLRAAMVIVSQ
jgi:molecular chaperone GrpE